MERKRDKERERSNDLKCWSRRERMSGRNLDGAVEYEKDGNIVRSTLNAIRIVKYLDVGKTIEECRIHSLNPPSVHVAIYGQH